MESHVGHWQYEEDDTVAILPKSGGIKIGLVSETYEVNESSDEDDSMDGSRKLKQGQVRVEWYPTGKEAAITANKVFLLDRALLMGEIVCRRSQPNRIGSVRNVSICADFLLLPKCEYVVRNICNERIEFVNKYDDASSSAYVAYENWAGALVASSDKLLLKSEEGYQCWISTNDCIDDLYDCCTKRLETSSYNTRQWYEGEPVKCTFKSLENAHWLPTHKPPDTFFRKLKSSGKIIKFTVTQVEPEFINVRWIAAVSGPNASIHPPSSTISGSDLEKVRKMDHFEYQATQIGDRIWVEIGEDDIVVPYSKWKEELRCELERHQGSADVVANATRPLDPPVVPSEEMCQTKVDDTGAGAAAGANDDQEDGESVTAVVETIGGSSKNNRLGVSAHRWKWSHGANAASPPRHRALAAAGKKRKPIRTKSVKAPVKREVSSNEAPPNVGERMVAEAMFVRSCLEIMWQDGELETGVLSTELGYASGDLDDHLFLPGNSVLLRDDETGKTWPECGYGVVEKVDVVNRVADVNWYEHILTSEDCTPKKVRANFIRKDQVSVYELVLHSDFDYTPGVYLMKIGDDGDEKKEWTSIGQVLHTNANGEVMVKWMDGRVEGVFPEQVCRVIGEYQFDDDTSEEDGSSSSDDDTDSDTWTTVSMDSSDLDEGDGEEDDTKDTVAGMPPETVSYSLTELMTAIESLRQNLLVLRTHGGDTSVRFDLASALIGLYSTLKHMARSPGGFRMDLSEHRYGKELLTCVRLLRAWVKTVKVKEKSSGTDVTGAVPHPAKENDADGDETDTESQLASELAVLHQVDEALRRLSDGNGNETIGNESNAAVANADGGLVAFVRKTLRSFVKHVQNHTPGGAGFRWRASASAGVSMEDEEKLATAQRLLQRGLERGENGAIDSNPALDTESESFASSFRTVVNDCANRCFQSDPKHRRALAVVDLSAAAVLMISRAVIIDLRDEIQKVSGSKETEGPVDGKEDGAGKEEKETQAGDRAVDESVQTDNSEQQQPSDTNELESTPVENSDCFELLETAPSNHKFIGVLFDVATVSSRFVKAVRQEMKLLHSSLPAGVFVKAFEDRMDLYSCMLIGPAGTPYMDGLFFFDVNLKLTYPNEPPVFHFKSFSTEQLNPNLYQDGKVCVSLLGTWSGKDSEVWNPGSNLLQVLVSIQGLILNAEPYFNEAGYEAKRVHPESAEKARRYNELALIRSVESLWKLSSCPPVGFEKNVHHHLAERGRKLIETVEGWIEGSPCGFPLQPVSQGFALSAKKQLQKLAQALEKMGL